jgi:flavin reductase (DIM6/NTAB) family NADH-FMN oxidoreductase RutF
MARSLTPAAVEPPELSAAEWRAAMGSFPSGVTVVTSWRDEAPVGSTISAFCSVSLKPPLLLICIDLNNPIREPVAQSGVFGVNILPSHGQAIARHFGRPPDPERDRFEDHAFDAAPGGAPQLKSAAVFIDCIVEDAYTAGDHVVVIGRGLRTDHAPLATPLLYHKGRFPTFEVEP